jgi:hypothetical protein
VVGLAVRVRAINKYGAGEWSEEAYRAPAESRNGGDAAVALARAQRTEQQRRDARAAQSRWKQQEARDGLRHAMGSMVRRAVGSYERLETAITAARKQRVHATDGGLFGRAEALLKHLELRKEVEANVGQWRHELKHQKLMAWAEMLKELDPDELNPTVVNMIYQSLARHTEKQTWPKAATAALLFSAAGRDDIFQPKWQTLMFAQATKLRQSATDDETNRKQREEQEASRQQAAAAAAEERARRQAEERVVQEAKEEQKAAAAKEKADKKRKAEAARAARAAERSVAEASAARQEAAAARQETAAAEAVEAAAAMRHQKERAAERAEREKLAAVLARESAAVAAQEKQQAAWPESQDSMAAAAPRGWECAKCGTANTCDPLTGRAPFSCLTCGGRRQKLAGASSGDDLISEEGFSEVSAIRKAKQTKKERQNEKRAADKKAAAAKAAVSEVKSAVGLTLSDDDLHNLLDERKLARRKGDWAKSDAIREKLRAKVLESSACYVVARISCRIFHLVRSLPPCLPACPCLSPPPGIPAFLHPFLSLPLSSFSRRTSHVSRGLR